MSAPPQSFAARRLEIMAAARAAGGALVSFDPAKLRFSLGTSITDVRIPVHVAPDAAAIVGAAASELAMLLATHHQHFVPADELDRVYMSEGYANLPAPAATLGPSGGGADLRGAAQLGAAAHPALTGGILCAWMGPGGRGRSLTALFIQALQQALAEAEETHQGEETPLIAAMALADELLRAEGCVREVMPAPPVDRYLRSATSIGLWIAAGTGLGRAWRDAGRPAGDALSLKLEAVLSPWLLLGGGVTSLGGATLYGCELTAAVPRSEEAVARLVQGADPDTVVGDLAHTLAADEDLSRRAEGAVAVGRLREMLLSGVVQAEAAGRGGGMSALREVYTAPGALASACAEEGARLQLAARVEAAALVGGRAGAALEEVARALRAWRRKEPATCVALTRQEACAEYALSAGAVACDAALERLLGRARRAVVARTGSEAEGGLDAEREGGRLYRISARAEPILKSARQRPLAHLFADLKDFTRRTELLGPAAMAEFLRTEFYRPILDAAKGFFAGMPHLADRGGIALNNLVGDAITFSGDIEALVALSAEIRRLLLSYQVRLAREISSEAVGRQLAALAARFEDELQGAARAISEARAARASPARLQQLEERRVRVAEERDRAVARARGGALEAGVFLSFGPAPVTVLIDDDVFGRSRVAIAEKINESARGTARAASARARADAALASERASRGTPGLQHAWSVFVGPPLSIAVPPEVERAALAAARAGDLAAALRTLAGPVRQLLERVVADSADEPGDIYNSGVALSEEALTSFLHAAKDSRQVRRVGVEANEIPSDLRARWFYGVTPLELVVTFSTDGRPAELFRRAGAAHFKGLGAVPVWELAASDGGPAELVKHFAARWFNGR